MATSRSAARVVWAEPGRAWLARSSAWKVDTCPRRTGRCRLGVIAGALSGPRSSLALTVLSSSLTMRSAARRSFSGSARRAPNSDALIAFCGSVGLARLRSAAIFCSSTSLGCRVSGYRRAERHLHRAVRLLGIDVQRQRTDLERLGRAFERRQLEDHIGVAFRAGQLRGELHRLAAGFVGTTSNLGRSHSRRRRRRRACLCKQRQAFDHNLGCARTQPQPVHPRSLLLQ